MFCFVSKLLFLPVAKKLGPDATVLKVSFRHFPMQKNINEKNGVVLFYIFVNHFNIWLDRRQLDSHICFRIQSVVMSHIRYNSRYTGERMKGKKANKIILF